MGKGQDCADKILKMDLQIVGRKLEKNTKTHTTQIERRLSVTNLSSENNLPTFRLNAPVVIRAKVRNNVAMYCRGYMSLEVKGR